MSFSTTKFKELILYIAQKQQDDQTFGRVKLAKLLFFADFEAYGRLGEAISGASYQKLEQGPAARQYKPVSYEMYGDGDIREEVGDSFGHTQMKLVPLREARVSVFTDEELAIIDQIVEEHRGMSAAEISEKSHRLMGWRVARLHERIPYEAVFIGATARPDDIERARELALERGWVEAF